MYYRKKGKKKREEKKKRFNLNWSIFRASSLKDGICIEL
jgi:hypothetical protein